MITLELPYPPSVNNYWQVARNRIIKTKQARDYKKTIEQLMLVYSKQIRGWIKDIEQDNRPLALAIAVHYPKRGGPLADIDNLLKVSIDCLEGILFKNDRQFRHVQISREAQNKKEGSIRVTIKECPSELNLHDGTFIVKGVHSRG
jgi:crossover junction endodeoxyribonuclease RusA